MFFFSPREKPPDRFRDDPDVEYRGQRRDVDGQLDEPPMLDSLGDGSEENDASGPDEFEYSENIV